MIVVDASALVAIMLAEPEAEQFEVALHGAGIAWLSPINYVETGLLLVGRGAFSAPDELDAWLAAQRVSVRRDSDLAGPAMQAYLAYGEGRHPARLNLADCFAYALAKQLDVPLLYKGDDFAKTDIRSAL
ncbi:type II toxin-antitoxin system VapC family toxin [Phenylobacterium sp.]|uniref:type II toxin-antitoxin system VapC family toxin n=1 Tax=Phenylobacterium sp. TaxID=1871053 RepID=UPI002EDA6833